MFLIKYHFYLKYSMKLAIIGTGYVGLVTGVCFSEMGNEVICVDNDPEKIAQLKNGISPIYEPGLDEMIKNNYLKTLYFTTDLSEAIKKSEILFIAVGTPMKEDGHADLSAVYSIAKEIGKTFDSPKTIISKSTVPVGTCDRITEIIQKELNTRGEKIHFDVVSNPEFLKEGAAISDFMKPDRVVIGAANQEVVDKMKILYAPFFRTRDRFVTMDVRSAEMTKYAANAMLATKISFMNEIASICEKLGADVNQVRVGIGSDSRIGYDFIYPGIGFGGTCFPKDLSALIEMGKENAYLPKILTAVEAVNKEQKMFFLKRIIDRFGENLSGFSFAIWGLSFKPETDDMREAPSVYIINELLKRGAVIKAYDPKAMIKAREVYFKGTSVIFGEDKYSILKGASALIFLTEWKEFRSPDFTKIKIELKEPVVFDGRNQYTAFRLPEQGFEYFQIGKKQ